MSNPKQAVFLAVAALALLAGCNQQGGAELAVTSIFPGDGYHGFKNGDQIVLEFNRPVDINSFLAAYHSSNDGLLPNQISYSAADGGKKIIIQPGKPLPYSSNENYLYYSFRLDTSLTDLSGHNLKQPLSVTFTTLRSLSATILADPAFDGVVSASLATNDEESLFVGDGNDNEAVRSLWGFPWPDGMEGVVEATLRLHPVQRIGTPFIDLGLINIEPVDLGEAIDLADYSSAALALAITDDRAGLMAGITKRYNVSNFAREAWNHGLARLDLRLRFTADSDNDGNGDYLIFYAREAETEAIRPYLSALELTYYAP